MDDILLADHKRSREKCYDIYIRKAVEFIISWKQGGHYFSFNKVLREGFTVCTSIFAVIYQIRERKINGVFLLPRVSKYKL